MCIFCLPGSYASVIKNYTVKVISVTVNYLSSFEDLHMVSPCYNAVLNIMWVLYATELFFSIFIQLVIFT